MSKNKDEFNEQEPWDQPIYEDQVDNDDDYSRADRRFKEEGKNWYVIILVILLFLIVLVPVSAILYFNYSTKMNEGTAKNDKIVVESSSSVDKKSSVSSETKESSTASSTTESSSSTSSSSSSSSTSSTFRDVEVSPEDAQNNQNVVPEQNDNTQTTPANGSYVTYGDSDSNRSLWKIAESNGITVDQLYQLNPGVTDQNIQPNQSIRIK